MAYVAVIGANGRVGTEVCLLLSKLPGVTVVPITRSRYASAFLRRMGLRCRVGSITDSTSAARLLHGADLIVDFSLPLGMLSVATRAVRANVLSILRNAPRRARYVFISSTVAIGTTDTGMYQPQVLARTPYAAQKRHGERFAQVCGRLFRREVFVLRLGEVHGELQPCSHQLEASLDGRKIALPDRGGALSDVVLCSTIALALKNIAEGRETPGVYTVVESPDWSLRRVYTFYAERTGKIASIIDSGELIQTHVLHDYVRLGSQLIARHRSLLMTQLLPRLAAVEQWVRAPYHTRMAAREIAAGRARFVHTPQHRIGPVPGRRLRTLRDTADTMAAARQSVREWLRESDARLEFAATNSTPPLV